MSKLTVTIMSDASKSILEKDLELSDDSDSDTIDPKYLSMSNKEIMARILMNTDKMKKKFKNLEREVIPKIEKDISNLKADNVEQGTRIEYLEKNEENNVARINKVEVDVVEVTDQVKQLVHKETKQQKTMDSLAEAMDEESGQIKDLNQRIERLEKNQKEASMLKQMEMQMNDKLSSQRAEVLQNKSMPIINQNRRKSIQQELNESLAESSSPQEPSSSHAPHKPSYSVTLSLPKATPGPVPTPKVVHKPQDIPIQTRSELMNEIATNIGILNVNADTIRKFSKNKDKHRASDETVRSDPTFKGARNLFVGYILRDVLKFNTHEIRFDNVRFSSRKESNILYFGSDKSFIKNIFIRASSIKNDKVRFIPFTPGNAYN